MHHWRRALRWKVLAHSDMRVWNSRQINCILSGIKVVVCTLQFETPACESPCTAELHGHPAESLVLVSGSSPGGYWTQRVQRVLQQGLDEDKMSGQYSALWRMLFDKWKESKYNAKKKDLCRTVINQCSNSAKKKRW